MVTTIATLIIEHQNFKNDLQKTNNLTEKRNAFQANKEWLLPFSNIKCIKKKHAEEKAVEPNNTFSTLEHE